MAQKIKYETTQVSAARSARQIKDLIRKYRATSFREDYDEAGDVVAIRFTFRLGDTVLPIVLRPAIDRIYELLTPPNEDDWGYAADVRKETRRKKSKRIAWRHLMYLTEQMLLSAELGMKTIHEVFMSDIEVYDAEADEDVTLGEMFVRRQAVGFLPPTRKQLNP